MSGVREQEIRANLTRAGEALDAARVLTECDLYNSAASRAYYAAFHAATAALLAEKESFKTHASVLAAFHRIYVKTGRIDSTCGKALNQLFELRAVGDYGEIEHVTVEEAEYSVQLAERFVSAVRRLLEELL